jgi:uncharacterized protein
MAEELRPPRDRRNDKGGNYMNHPLMLILMTGAGVYLGKLWFDDRTAARRGQPNANALPGASDASTTLMVVAVIGALLLLTVETIGEIALGISAQQSKMTWISAIYSMIAAPIIEEIVFRGWLVVERRGPRVMWAGVVVASLGFALVHPFLWNWDQAGFVVTLTAKGWFSSGIAFATSLWLYALRLGPWNPQRSLLPCFAGHAAKNIGVVAVKAATGYMI